ncbi:TonB-dependent receptor [Ferrimonas marina]|uniref:Iron complex outermembrane recepter protein n=1 Tax=Ferrimonas marina TaxID=299255 RepID=A0A1M5QXD5_9GAMM|nr:TonB-dependent receptor [Ferrimonas marina]SHH18389.1 iron complex outermembrane recepter protein [Ferrimonas marina]
MQRQPHTLSACTLAVLAALSHQAQAEEAASSEAQYEGLERIEVTARRQVETLQEVPVAVTSVSDTEIEAAGIEVLTEIQKISPNTTLQVSRGTNTTLTAFIRGIGQQDPLWGFEPGVGIYVDDVYIARPQGAVLNVFDVSRVEVLRGPQGTLYGKNTIGGAVKYVSREMHGDTAFDVKASYGSYNQMDLKFNGQTPIVQDRFYLGLGLARLTRDGFGEFLGPLNAGDENYNKDIWAGRVSAEWYATDDLKFRLSYDQTQDDSNAKGGHRLLEGPAGEPVLDDVYDSRAGEPTFNEVKAKGVAFTASWDASANWTGKYIYSWRDNESDTNIDFDSLQPQYFDVPAVYDDSQQTHELQASYAGDRIKGVMGLYYFDGDACGAYHVILSDLLGVPFDKQTAGCTDTQSYAAYAQGTYYVTDALSFTLGGRYTKDEKTGGTTVDTNQFIVSEWENSADWTQFSPRAGVEYRFTSDLMTYASYSQGFKSGGFDPRGDLSVNPQADRPFDPEIVDTYEIGVKSEWLDNRLRTNLAWFYNDYQDMQIIVAYSIDTDSDGVDDTPVNGVDNAGKASAWGLELESTLLITEGLTADLIIGYLDAEIDEWIDGGVDVSDDRVVSNTPDWTGRFALNYTRNFSFGDMVFTGSANYRGDTTMFEVPAPLLDQEAYTLVDVGITWYSNNGHWSLGAYGKNLTDEQARVAGYNFENLGNTLTSFHIDPRTFTLTLGYSF